MAKVQSVFILLNLLKKKLKNFLQPKTNKMTKPQEFFNSLDPKQKSKLLAENYENALSLENEPVSIYSDVIVSSSEEVARRIFSPHSYDHDTGELTTLALDDVFNKGLSVNRLSMVNTQEIHHTGIDKIVKIKELDSETNKEYVGFSVAEVKKIRECTEDDEKRWFTVYNTGNKEDISHADVCCIYPPEGTAGRKKVKSRQRDNLRKVFSKIVKPTS